MMIKYHKNKLQTESTSDLQIQASIPNFGLRCLYPDALSQCEFRFPPLCLTYQNLFIRKTRNVLFPLYGVPLNPGGLPAERSGVLAKALR